MNKLAGIFLCFGLLLPVEGRNLQGKVVFREQPLRSEAPVLARDLWRAWKAKLAQEIVDRTSLRLREASMPSEGSLEVYITVTSEGDICSRLVRDDSSNTSLVLQNVISRMDHALVLVFPTGVPESQIGLTLRVETQEDQKLTYLSR